MGETLAEFYFSDCRTIRGQIVHVGRVFEGRVCTGEYFQELRRIRASTNAEVEGRGRNKFETLEICPVDLKIQVIHFADRSIERCEAGYTCGLELAGKGLELLRNARSETLVSFYDLLVIRAVEFDLAPPAIREIYDPTRHP